MSGFLLPAQNFWRSASFIVPQFHFSGVNILISIFRRANKALERVAGIEPA